MPWFDACYRFLVALHPFLQGFTAALCFTAGVLFLRFYHRTRDRFFLFFAAAFCILSFNRLLFMLIDPGNDDSTTLYLVRLLSFGLILVGILDKNRKRT